MGTSKVWNLKYREVSNYQPRTGIPEGNLPAEFINRGGGPILPLEDPTADGGTSLRSTTMFSGRRVRPESVPTKLLWLSKRTPTDFQWTTVYSVSGRLKALIESLEPEAHQFEPLALVTKRGEVIEDRWFWQVCNRLDTVDPELRTMTRDRYPSFWTATDKGQKFVIDPAKAGAAKFWRDKHLSMPILLCTHDVKLAFDRAKITGTRFEEVETSYGPQC